MAVIFIGLTLSACKANLTPEQIPPFEETSLDQKPATLTVTQLLETPYPPPEAITKFPTVGSYPGPQTQAAPRPAPQPYPEPVDPGGEPAGPTIEPETQLYTDPEGIFTVLLPADWTYDPDEGIYQGKDGFFRATYLPEMAFMDFPIRVCERLANSSQGPTHKILWGEHQGLPFCVMKPLPDRSMDSVQAVIRFSYVTQMKRFLSIEADAQHIN